MPEFVTDYLSGLADSLLVTLKRPDAYLNKVSLTVLILAAGIALYVLLKKMITHNVKDFTKRYRAHKVWKNFMMTLVIFLILFIWIRAINALILIALLSGVFAVFMVRGLTNNIIGFFVIRYRKYFEVGHRVEINGVVGDVIEINPIHFKLLEVRGGLSSDANTGRIIKLPNQLIFNESIEIIGVENIFIWHEIKHILSFDSDWRAAEKIMTDAGQSYLQETLLPELGQKNGHAPKDPKKLEPVFSVDVNDAGIVLILRYLVDYRKGTKVKTALQREMLTCFTEHPAIEFAAMEVKILKE